MQNARYPDAQKRAEEGQTIARGLAERPDSLPDHRALLASALETHGETLVGQERQPDGLALYKEACALRLSLVNDFPKEFDFRRRSADCHEAIAGLQKDRGDISAAKEELDSALSLWRSLAKEFPPSQSDVEALLRCESARRSLDGL
jgi:hypothetical protein